MPTIALWRGMRRWGAVRIVDGLVALPFSAKTRERMEGLAEEAWDAGAEAGVWLARPGLVAVDRELTGRMTAAPWLPSIQPS